MKELLKTKEGCQKLVDEFGYHPRRIAQECGIASHSYIVRKLQEFGVRGKAVSEVEINFPDKKVPLKRNGRELLVELKDRMARRKACNPYQDNDEATAVIKTDKPIILLPTADWHIGEDLDVDSFLEFIDIVVSTPYIYLFLTGDYSDNFLSAKFMGKIISSYFTPEEQQETLEWAFEMLEDRILSAMPGNHDLFLKKLTGFRSMTDRSVKFPVFKHGVGHLNLVVGGQRYEVHGRHQYRFNSSLNYTHTVKQMYKNDRAFDIGVVSHHHSPAYEPVPIQGNEVHCVRTASFKKDDDFAKNIGFGDAGCNYPALVLFPGEKEISGHWKLKHAIRFCQSYYKEQEND